MHRRIQRLAVLLVLVLSFSSLANAQGRRGSIYDPEGGPYGLVANKTARSVGDLITVVISETQDLKNEEKADLLKETDLRYQITNFDIKPGAFDVLPQLGGDSEDSFTGTANYEKKGTFTARLTAVVVDALPNGNLVVNGRREIKVDNETKVIEFSGVVRRYDISPSNTVQSELVANAKVFYTGSGPLTEHTNRNGLGAWIHKAIDWLWPF